jgi:hypothetical protein
MGSGAPCATACAASDDYCGTPGEITSSKCNTCFDTYVASGATCDPTSGTIAAACSANTDCSNYTTCSTPCQ